MMEPQTIHSEHLGSPRTVWRSGRGPTCLFLDGELYLDRVEAPKIIESLTCAYVSYGTPEARHTDFICSEAYAQFVTEELLPWLEDDVLVLVGLSLSGLAAAHIALHSPDEIPAVVAQSPSAWWNDNWLTSQVSESDAERVPIWISVGTQETDDDVRHAPTLHQTTSQFESCERLAKAWGDQAKFVSFEGGHDPACWAAELADAVAWALARNGTR